MLHHKRIVLGASLLGALTLFGCSNQANAYSWSGRAAHTTQPADSYSPEHFDAAGLPHAAITGVVTREVDSGSFTYVRLETGNGAVWVAGPRTALSKGDSVTAAEPRMVKNYRTRALGRTFPRIYFTATFVKPGTSVPLGVASTKRS